MMDLNNGELSPKVERKLNRTFILEFIETYKSLTALWDTKCIDYTDRHIKDRQYDILLKKYREEFPEAGKKLLSRRINILRSNLRKEFKRMKRAKERAEAENKEVITETDFWYYDAMNFILDDEDRKLFSQSQRSKRSIEHEDDEEYADMDELLDASQGFSEESYEMVTRTAHAFNHSEKRRRVQSELYKETIMLPTPNPSKKTMPNTSNSPMMEEQIVLPPLPEPQLCTEFQKMSDLWALKMQRMPRSQQLFAEKFIGDILFEGQLGNLNRNSVQIMKSPSFEDTFQSYCNDSQLNSKDKAVRDETKCEM